MKDISKLLQYNVIEKSKLTKHLAWTLLISEHAFSSCRYHQALCTSIVVRQQGDKVRNELQVQQALEPLQREQHDGGGGSNGGGHA